MLAESSDGVGTLIELLSIPGWVIGIAALTILLLSGKIMRRSDHEEVVRTIKEDFAQRDRAKDERLQAVVADRNAWRTAHEEEVKARQAAERAAGALMEGTATVNALIEALHDALRPEK